jgi:hypothetical protein
MKFLFVQFEPCSYNLFSYIDVISQGMYSLLTEVPYFLFVHFARRFYVLWQLSLWYFGTFPLGIVLKETPIQTERFEGLKPLKYVLM